MAFGIMSVNLDDFELEQILYEELHKTHIPASCLGDYYVILLGLRLRLFEGCLAGYFPAQSQLFNLCSELQKHIICDQTQELDIKDIIGKLNRIRNPILHGNFKVTIDKDFWESIDSFLTQIERHLDITKNSGSQDLLKFNNHRSLKSDIFTFVQAYPYP